MNISKLILSCLLSLFWSGLLLAQSGAITFEAYADAREILEGGEFQLIYSIKNGEAQNFQAPSFTNFQQVSLASKGFKTTISNGLKSEETTISYRLKATRTGSFTIPPATISTNGRTINSNTVSINVVPRKAGGGDRTNQVFIKAEPNITAAYVGQQITLDYVLYTRVEVDRITPVNESAYEGFYSREVERYDNRLIKVVENGVQYVTRTIKRVVLYPQKSGVLTIEPYALNLGVITDASNRPRSFFYRPKRTRVAVSSEEFTINVNALPSPQPENFSGITGTFKLITHIGRNKITTDDALSVIISLKGEGDLKRITAPTFDFPEAFDVYDPNLIKEEYFDFFDRVEGEKKYEYLLVPEKEGVYILEPKLVIFNPDSAKYVTISTRPFPVNVQQGSGTKTAIANNQNDSFGGIAPPLSAVDLHTSTANFLLKTPVGWVLLAVPFFFIGGLFVHRKKQLQKGDIDPVLLKQQQAREEALKRLTTAEAFRLDGNSKAFYDEVEKALLGYIGDKLQIPRSQMTKSNVEIQLGDLKVDTEKVNQFMALLKTCEMALYAGKDNAAAMESTYHQTLSLVSEMEVSIA